MLQNIIKILDQISETTGKIISWLSTFLVLVVCADVFTRYVLHESKVAVQELEWHIFAALFLVAIAYTLKHDRHVRVDVFYTNFSKRTKAWIDFFGTLFFLIPFTLVLIWASQPFIINAFTSGEISPNPGGLPFRFLAKGLIPFGFSLLFLQGISQLCKSFQILVTPDTSEHF